MKTISLFLIVICFSFLSCDNGAICVFANKNVTISNDTAYNLVVIVRNNITSFQVGTIKGFEVKTFNVSHSVLLVVGNTYFSNQLYIDPCKKNLELIVED